MRFGHSGVQLPQPPTRKQRLWTRNGLSDEERFWGKVNRVDAACWEWLGHRVGGYGKFSVFEAGRHVMRGAHRIAWEYTHGPIPPEHEIDHLCRNRGCVRPDHLQVVGKWFNARQGSAEACRRDAARTHCARGHALDERNTLRYRRERRCRKCSYLSWKAMVMRHGGFRAYRRMLAARKEQTCDSGT